MKIIFKTKITATTLFLGLIISGAASAQMYWDFVTGPVQGLGMTCDVATTSAVSSAKIQCSSQNGEMVNYELQGGQCSYSYGTYYANVKGYCRHRQHAMNFAPATRDEDTGETKQIAFNEDFSQRSASTGASKEQID